MMRKHVINICFCIDENYVHQLGAVLYSLIESNHKNNIDIYVLINNVSKISQERLGLLIQTIDNFSINFIESQDSEVQKLEAGGHISSATYIRFEIPSLLSNLEKVLYLDADIVISDDLSELFNTNIENNYVAAVENPFFDRYESLGMSRNDGYFNAGVLLINLSLWRERNIKNKAINFLSSNKLMCIMFDQDALNAIFQGKWKKVDIRWNLQTSFIRGRKRLPDLIEQIDNAFLNPAIIHYSSSSKPWDILDPHPLTYIYRKYEAKFGKYRKRLSFFQLLRSFVKWGYLKYFYF